MTAHDHRPRGRLHLRVSSSDGAVVEERRARNIVLRRGASIIAGLFSGAAGVTAIDQIRVGFALDGATPDLEALTPPADATIPAAALRSPVTPADFKVVDGPGSVQVLLSSVFRPSVELKDVTEAGLLAGDTLYNQVVFEPVTLRPGQDVTFFWQVDFPFGH